MDAKQGPTHMLNIFVVSILSPELHSSEDEMAEAAKAIRSRVAYALGVYFPASRVEVDLAQRNPRISDCEPGAFKLYGVIDE